jgi:hypothetical protein
MAGMVAEDETISDLAWSDLLVLNSLFTQALP